MNAAPGIEGEDAGGAMMQPDVAEPRSRQVRDELKGIVGEGIQTRITLGAFRPQARDTFPQRGVLPGVQQPGQIAEDDAVHVAVAAAVLGPGEHV